MPATTPDLPMDDLPAAETLPQRALTQRQMYLVCFGASVVLQFGVIVPLLWLLSWLPWFDLGWPTEAKRSGLSGEPVVVTLPIVSIASRASSARPGAAKTTNKPSQPLLKRAEKTKTEVSEPAPAREPAPPPRPPQVAAFTDRSDASRQVQLDSPRPSSPPRQPPATSQPVAMASQPSLVAGSAGSVASRANTPKRIGSRGSEENSLPRLTYNPPPDFPAEAYQQGIYGEVGLYVEVTARGEIASVVVAQSSGYSILDTAALEKVRSAWQFEPAIRDEHPVAMKVRVFVRFPRPS